VRTSGGFSDIRNALLFVLCKPKNAVWFLLVALKGKQISWDFFLFFIRLTCLKFRSIEFFPEVQSFSVGMAEFLLAFFILPCFDLILLMFIQDFFVVSRTKSWRVQMLC
jgi:hypothetical protein